MKFKLKMPKKDGIVLSALPALLIATVLVFIIYAVKGIFPFGSDSVAYMDMWQMNVPIYYHIYDALHGDKSIFYDCYTALGINMSESVAICSLLSPFNLFMYLIPRDGIMNFLPIFTLLKIDFSIFFMSVFLRYRFKNTHNFWRTLASLAYGFCGMNMMFCTNSQWLDIAALLPLLMLSLDYSMQNKKVVPYALMLGVCFITNPYISVMVLLFIFFAASIDILFFAPKNEKMLRIFHLGIGTVCGVAMSAFVLLPFMKQMGKASRSPSDLLTTFKAVLDVSNDYTAGYVTQKYWMLWGTALACAVIIYGIVLNWRSIKRNIASILCIAVVTLQIFFENINLIWHGGSYVLFPMRFGFITSFIIWTVAISYINDIVELNNLRTLRTAFLGSSVVKAVLKITWAVVCIAAIPILSYLMAKSFVDIDYDKRFLLSVIIFSSLVVLYILFINVKIKNIFRIILCTLLVAEMSAGVYLFIGKPYIDPYFQNNPDMEFAEEITDVGEEFELSDSLLSRVKNSDGRFTSNYPFIMKKSALSNWTHTVDAELQQAYKSIGYSIVYTRLLDTGGTVFLDALINVEDVITSQSLPQKSYTLNASNSSLNHYKTNYAFGFGTLMSSSILNSTMYDPFTAQENVYNAMSGEYGLFHLIQIGSNIDSNAITEKISEGNKVTYTINVIGCQNLYLLGNATIRININGNDLIIPDSGIQNYYYPVSYNNGILDLGVYEDETITLTLDYLNGIDENFLQIATMNYQVLDSLVQSDSVISASIIKERSNGFDLEVTGSDGKDLLLLPVSYDEGLTCKVNGKKVEVEKVLGCFSGVKVENGKNIISVKFVPEGMGKGLIITFAGAVLLLLYNFLFLRRKVPKFNRTVETIVVWEYGKFWVLMMIAIYLIPIYHIILNLIKT